MIKLFVSDVDGTLTDGTVFVSENGEEFKQFSHRDGRGFYLLRAKTNCKAAIFTSERGGINEARISKLIKHGTVQYYRDGNTPGNKLVKLKYLCEELGISLQECAFIGDDTNDYEALVNVGIAACPRDAIQEVLDIPGIHVMAKKGGNGAVRAFIDYLIIGDYFDT
jgi:YrbI family 3-deoxy-D-manno-octulosonate 8-phosphate phosphatase